MPTVFRALHLSLLICCVGAGINALPVFAGLAPRPASHLRLVERTSIVRAVVERTVGRRERAAHKPQAD